MVRKYILLFIAFTSMSFLLLKAQTTDITPTLYQKADKPKMKLWVDSVLNNMSLDERIGQLFTVITLGSIQQKEEILNQVKNEHVGGIIFLKGSPLIQASITNDVQKLAKTPVMISIDGEWGLAMRLAGTTRFPKNMMLGAIQNDSLLYYYGKEMARQCRLMGIHVNFAPDMDTNTNPENPVIGIRSYGENPELVAKKGIMYAKGLEDGNVLSVAKHFPGHGNTSTDSHRTLPVVTESRERIDKHEIIPFRDYINNGLGGIMVGHLNIPALDTMNQPSSLSKNIVNKLLQDSLGFSGLVFTDGLAMKGVSTQENHCVRALLAGNDILLGPINLSKEFKSVKKTVNESVISEELINRKCRKILEYKYLLNIRNEAIAIDSLIQNLNTDYADWLNRKLNEKAITLLKNKEDIVPLKKLDERKIVAVSVGATVGNGFHKTLKKYGKVACYSVANAAELNAIKAKLAPYNTIILSIHSTKGNIDTAISNVCKDKDYILTFFTIPYQMTKYNTSINDANAVILAYENTPLAMEYAAQAIFGGIDVDGRLPVSIKGLFNVGDGINTHKSRLKYSSPEEVGIESYKLSSIEQIVQEGIDEKAYPGCQVLIVKDGVVIYERASGTFEYNKDEQVTTESIYDLASMTKAVATLPAIMKLYDKKKITLNSTISSFVPILRGTNKANITIRQALFHQSRLPSFFPYYMKAIDENSYTGRLFSRTHTPIHNIRFDGSTWARTDYDFKSDLVSTIEKKNFLPIADSLYINKIYKDSILKSIADIKLRNRTEYMYSCLNFMLLKEVVENNTKADLNSFLQNNFYKKMGMDRTTYNPLTLFRKDEIVPTENDGFLRKQTIRGYVHDEAAAFMGGISGNAGLFSDANDIAKLCQMYLNDGKYGGEEYLTSRTSRLFTQTRSPISHRGLGFDKPETRTNKSSPCSPSTPRSVYGHTGFTGTCFWIDPDNDLIFIFLSNRIYPKRTHNQLIKLNIRQRIQETIYQSFKNKNV